MSYVKPEIRALIAGYLANFAAANPISPPPSITYEAGWFRFESTGGLVVTRYRKAKLIEMNQRLMKRVAENG